jgi:hypothetical protein
VITSDVIKGHLCPVCQVPGHVCGDNHMRRGPVDNFVQEGTAVTEPAELKEYVYVVNNMKTTAMLTPKMAERLGAVEVDGDPSTLNGGYTQGQNQAVYSSSDMRTGVTGEGAVEPIRPQQQGIDDEGRTRSMRSPQEQGIEPAPEPGDTDESTSDASTTTTASGKSIQIDTDASGMASRKTRRAQDK